MHRSTDNTDELRFGIVHAGRPFVAQGMDSLDQNGILGVSG
jgi:hypothetical protein